MDLNLREATLLEERANVIPHDGVRELSDSQLALVGGGVGEVIVG